ncbi:cdc37 [Symbiodinium microadriaticum]|nr:cdc37 [Symbiodinium microadriaticum]
MSGFDYSKWDRLEISDDETTFHPNLDTGLNIRVNRITRDRKEEEIESEKKKLMEKGEKDKAEKLESKRPLHVNNVCHVAEERTIIQSSDGSRKDKLKKGEESFSVDDYTLFKTDNKAILDKFANADWETSEGLCKEWPSWLWDIQSHLLEPCGRFSALHRGEVAWKKENKRQRSAEAFGSIRLFSDSLPRTSPLVAFMSDFADFLAAAGLDLVFDPTTSPSAPTASLLAEMPGMGVGEVAGEPILGDSASIEPGTPAFALDLEFSGRRGADRDGDLHNELRRRVVPPRSQGGGQGTFARDRLVAAQRPQRTGSNLAAYYHFVGVYFVDDRNGGEGMGATWSDSERCLQAAAVGDTQELQRLHAHGVDVNASDSRGKTTAMEAAAGGRQDCLSLIIRYGADLNASDNRGWTAAMHAAFRGELGCLQLLIENGAKVECEDFLGTTPLMRHALRPGDWKLHIAVVHVVAGSIEESKRWAMPEGARGILIFQLCCDARSRRRVWAYGVGNWPAACEESLWRRALELPLLGRHARLLPGIERSRPSGEIGLLTTQSGKILIQWYGHILMDDYANSYFMLAALDAEMKGDRKEMEKLARQGQIISQIHQLAEPMRRPARDLVPRFFEKFRNDASRMAFQEGVDHFKKHLIQRAIVKKQEEAEEAKKAPPAEVAEEDMEPVSLVEAMYSMEKEERMGPGGLDPVEVFESLPVELQECFKTGDVEKLKEVAQTMEPKDFEHHFQRCIDAGLWSRG